MGVAELIAILTAEFTFRTPVVPGTPLLTGGFIDSLQFSELLSLLEERFAISLDLIDLGYENFDTPIQMCEMIGRVRGASD